MKCFLSHSSADKKHYVSKVASQLSPRVNYDEMTFEEGLGNIEEIAKGLTKSEVFVLFLSENSLESEWVKKEILAAKELFDSGLIKRIFPIVIDKSITHKDHRIPDWMREEYNLRPISRPMVAARRIRERLIELSWNDHPILKRKNTLFVGRNDLLSKIEERFNDLSLEYPIALYASGLRDIGRKSLLQKSLQKTNTFGATYSPALINLTHEDGLEGFIEKVSDLGITHNGYNTGLIDKSVNEKIDISIQILDEIAESKEVIFIEDNGCIVQFGGEISEWFIEICNRCKNKGVMLGIASRFKAARSKYIRNTRHFFIEVPELNESERSGLLKRYCELLDVDLTQEEMVNIASLMTGYPEQVTHAVERVKIDGYRETWKNSHEIREYSTFKAALYVDKILGEKLDLLKFLSKFDFLSISFIDDISKQTQSEFLPHVYDFLNESICERVGASGEYVRVNDVIRDYVNRNDLQISEKLRSALAAYVDKFLSTYETENYDVSEYYIVIKEALISSTYVPDNLLIPAHFLRSMKDLYNARKYGEVIQLADQVLLKRGNYDNATEQDIRYYLCQSLARKKNDRFLSEVMLIDGPEHDFLFGFFYRLKGQYSKAIDRYNKSIDAHRTSQRARRELVLVYSRIEAFDEALILAKDNHEKYPANPFLIQSYFECLIRQPKNSENRKTLEGLIQSLKKISGIKADEIGSSLYAKYISTYEGKFNEAIEHLNKAILKFTDNNYPLLTKLDLAIYNQDKALIDECLADLPDTEKNRIISLKGKAISLALEGKKNEALHMISSKLSSLHPKAQDALKSKIETAPCSPL